MSKTRAFGFAVVALLLCHAGAAACTCNTFSVREKFRRAGAVFVGKVVEKTPTRPSEEFPSAASVVRFEVERRWKGAEGREVTAVADFDAPYACSTLTLTVGARYLIYAQREQGRLHVYTECSESGAAESAADEVKRLDSFWFRTKARLYPYPRF